MAGCAVSRVFVSARRGANFILRTSENLEGERKTVTTLFADIKSSTELIEDIGKCAPSSTWDSTCQYLFNGKTRFVHCSTFITGCPDHPRLTTRIDEKPKPSTLTAPGQECHGQVCLVTPRTGIQDVTYSIHTVPNGIN